MKPLRAAIGSCAAVVALGACIVPSDPDFQPVGHQLDGDVLVLLVPVCPGERIEAVILEDVEADEDEGELYERHTPDTRSGEIRVDLRDVPGLAAARSVVVTVVTNQLARASSLDLPEVPEASTMLYRLQGKAVTRPEVLAQGSCEKG